MEWIVRTVKGSKDRVSMTDQTFATKREAILAIEGLGKLSSGIFKHSVPGGRCYVVTPAAKS